MSPVDRPVGPNWYDVLDVEPTASTDEVRAAWRAAIADLTPADRRFRLYNQAAEVLLDPERRAAHDAELAAAAPAPSDDAAAEEGPAEVLDEAPAEPPPAPAAGPRRAPNVPTWLIAAVALLTAVAVAITALLWSQPSEATVAEAGTSARSAAERAVVPVLAYDWETLEQDREAAHAVMTPDYQEQYDQLFEVIEENAPSTRTVVEVEMVASGISRVNDDGNRASILLFVNRPTTNKVTREPVVYKDQVTLSMQRVDGEWLVDDVETSPAQQ